MENLILGFVLAPLILVPIAYKWELNLKAVLVGALAIGLFAGLLTHGVTTCFQISLGARLVIYISLIVATAVGVLLIRFYRDPDRIPPEAENLIVAPADGIVKYIKRIERGNIPFSAKGKEKVRLSGPLLDILKDGEGYLIGIAMTYLDVHVTRAAINGKLSYFEHVPGCFLSLKRDDAPYRNERLIEVIQNDRCKIGLIQIASRLVRRIVAYVREGDELDLGQRIGMITFGSQVDVVLPNLRDLEVKVSVGQQVYAGTSIIAEIQCA
jgi:phosphatidylserine decarboxylase